MRILILILFAVQSSLASFEPRGEGPRIAALGGASLALRCDLWCVLSNPACPCAPSWALSVMHEPSPFGLKELSRSGFAVACSPQCGTFAVTGITFGFDLYRETTLGLSFGREIAPALRAGAGLRFDRLSISGYGSGWTFAADVGIHWAVTEGVDVGLAARNVNAPSIGRSHEMLPRTFGVGAAYAPIHGMLVALDCVKDTRFPPEFHFGCEYSPLNALALRVGTGRNPASLGAGVGIAADPIVLNYAFEQHPALGVSHRIGFDLRLGSE